MTHIDIDVFATRGLHGPYAKDRSIFGLPDNIFLYKKIACNEAGELHI